MSNRSNKRQLPPSTMARVKACSSFFLDSTRRRRIYLIAINDDLDQATIRYTIGCCKRSIRQGIARNYDQALDKLEAEQVGDRGSPITRSISAGRTADVVNRINRINQGISIKGIGLYDYDVSYRIYGFNVDGEYTYIDTDPVPHYAVAKDKPINSGKGMGKVLGTLYTEWVGREEQLDPALVMMDQDAKQAYMQVEKNLIRFFAEYESRLGETSKARLHEIAKSTVNPSYLTSAEGYNDPETKREAKGARRLYDNFPHKDAIECKEFIELVRQYVQV